MSFDDSPLIEGLLEGAGKEENMFPAEAVMHEDDDGDVVGWSDRIGIYSGPLDEEGSRADLVQLQHHLGAWNGEDGKTNRGAKGDGSFMRWARGINDDRDVGAEIGLGTATGGLWTNEDTSSVSATAAIAEMAVTAGDEEENMRGGIAFGIGAGGRVHHGDADGDGTPELGFGADVGFASFDIRSETLGEAAEWLGLTSSGPTAADIERGRAMLETPEGRAKLARLRAAIGG